MKYIAAPAFLAGALALSVFAAPSTTLSGEIQGGISYFGALAVELVPTGGAAVPNRVYVSPSGAFDFRDVTQGVYELRVIDLRGDVIRRDIVSVGEGVNHHTVQLPERVSASPTGETISFAQLRHRVPKAALKLARRSESLFRKGELEGAVQALERAIALDPEFMQAHNNLGCRYMELRQPVKAAAAYAKAAQLDPSNYSVYVNLAVALIQSGNSEDAEVAARRAIALNPSSLRAKYALGMALHSASVMTVETLQLLHASASEFPVAALSLAQIYARLGWNMLASEQLGAYVEKGPPEQRAQAERWMNTLRATR